MFSVLMSVYYKENPRFLAESLNSVMNQTMPPDEVVVVKDGPLTDALDAVLDEYATKYPAIKLVPLDKNRGLGLALNEGLKHCAHEIVARMDSDDICKPHRFEKQLEVMRSNPDIDVVGSWIDEFTDDANHTIATRRLPEDHNSLKAYAKKRSPMNHPSIAFRKNAVMKAGGYMHFPLFEDYYLWVRMLNIDCRFANISESLVCMRISPEMYKRRGGMRYVRDEWRLQREFRKIGFISGREMAVNMAVRTIFRLAPNSLRGYMYKRFLRKQNN